MTDERIVVQRDLGGEALNPQQGRARAPIAISIEVQPKPGQRVGGPLGQHDDGRINREPDGASTVVQSPVPGVGGSGRT